MNQKQLHILCQEIAQQFNLQRVYFAQRIGKRVSFLAGIGEEDLLPKRSINIGQDLIFYYHSEEERDANKIKDFILKRWNNKNETTD